MKPGMIHFIVMTFMITITPVITTNQVRKAISMVPVADLVGSPLYSIQAYQELPLCGGTINPFSACKRMHQLLFNETVYVIKEHEQELYISLPNTFYTTMGNPNLAHTVFWIARDNVVFIDQLSQEEQSLLPPPISWKKPSTLYDTRTLTLALPWHDQESTTTFSVGTRFVRNQKQDTKHHYAVYVLDPITKKSTTKKVPHKACIIPNSNTSHQEQLQQMVQLIRLWIDNAGDGYVPYVWGGCSFTNDYKKMPFTENFTTINGTKASFFSINGDTQLQKIGFDCVGLLLRAAHIVGLPFFCKNTTSIERHIPPLQDNDSIAVGDLIIIPFHVMLVSNVKDSLLIESRSYPHGYGKVQELPLNKVFKKITTYKQLLHAAHTKKTVYRIDVHGKVRDVIPQVKILRIKKL